MTNRPRTKATPPRILVAVADEVLARALADPLADAGFAVTRLGNLSEVASVPADLVVVDRAASLEGDDALLTATGCALPIVALAAAEDSRAPAGAGGQVTLLRKPLRVQALIDGVRAGLAAGAGALHIGPCRLFASSRTLVGAGGETVRLTDKETQILTRLAAAIGRVVPRDILLAEVWGYGAAIATHTIETHVYRLRRKLAQAVAGGASLIRAEDGGYLLAATP
ncbi:MAG: winged helix-turn-helix domain-containing protein [Zavarzinia sp.]|nr:winged helix-turn-helix domain-containing protein [Zavarzinia sp.]